jgi:DNA end-binding protein Ku
MRTTWNGSLSFGLVNIPVGLAPATKPAARQSDVSFRMLHRECGSPIKQKRWCPVHDREVGPDEIVKGWEVAKGEFVVVEDADLEALERQDTSRTIEIHQFVDAGQVDPIYFDRTYFLAPAANAAARRPYVLLLNAMQETGRAALGRFVLAGKEKLVLIRARGGGLALETLFLHEDVYSQAEIEEAVADVELKDAELTLAEQVIESLAGDFDPLALTSDYRRDLKAMLQAKLEGAEIAAPEPVLEDAPVIDLMEALRKSVADAKERAGAGSNGTKKAKAAPKSGSRARRAPARKSA